jgi:hypothetical protein
LEEFPAELSKINVIVGRPPAELLKPFYSVEQVNEQNKDIHTEEYKTIVRIPFDPKKFKWCPEMVRVKDGWISTDGGKAPIPISPAHTRDKK